MSAALETKPGPPVATTATRIPLPLMDTRLEAVRFELRMGGATYPRLVTEFHGNDWSHCGRSIMTAAAFLELRLPHSKLEYAFIGTSYSARPSDGAQVALSMGHCFLLVRPTGHDASFVLSDLTVRQFNEFRTIDCVVEEHHIRLDPRPDVRFPSYGRVDSFFNFAYQKPSERSLLLVGSHEADIGHYLPASGIVFARWDHIRDVYENRRAEPERIKAALARAKRWIEHIDSEAAAGSRL